ncbi:unnamed protein product [Rhizoctonia solani]|uniref:Uncharacterized protein n=1 Tax=Rhizoctonia solani TaxID=456999 RepID=A0A8H3HXT4_9AGAM|nr:unnamed protein product [Rhizoctonia solani]
MICAGDTAKAEFWIESNSGQTTPADKHTTTATGTTHLDSKSALHSVFPSPPKYEQRIHDIEPSLSPTVGSQGGRLKGGQV